MARRKDNRSVRYLALALCVVLLALAVWGFQVLKRRKQPVGGDSQPTVTTASTETDAPTAPATEEPTQPSSPPATEPPTEPPTEPITQPTQPSETQPGQIGPFYEGPELLTLVNSTHPIPEDWTVDLITLNVGEKVDQRAYPALQAMMDDCRAAGNDPVICSGYRTRKGQETLYENRVRRWKRENPDCTEEEAREGAAFWVARPDTSEHQLGLTVDIVSYSNWNLDESQENTATQRWLMENSWRYGWILRYPTEKNAITRVGYEPWHYRYVGQAAAKEIYESGLCLEEYLNMVD